LEALNGPLHKAVLARQSVLQGTFSVAQSFEQLALQRPNAMVYALQHPEHGVWLGATPEILVRQHHHQLEVMSLAGTRPSGTAAPWGEKETMEQSLVTEYIHRIMAEACGEVQVIGPNTLMAGTVEHLCTQLIGVSATANAFQLAEQLHPTPAVCGWPMPAARQWIQAHEGMWRKLYTGYLGPVSHDQALLMVNLRCVNLFSTHAVAYAGGGWVQGSTPELEWEETNRKVASIAAHLVQAP
jgi:isochorismate synthase